MPDVSTEQSRGYARCAVFTLWLGLACCAAPVAYSIGPLSAEWTRSHVHAGDLVYHHRNGGTISVSGKCQPGRVEDVPLDVLTNHLLFDVQVLRESRDSLTLSGREAQSTHILGMVDGVTVEMELIVLKKDGCTYDLQLVAAPADFAVRRTDFVAFGRGFAVASLPGGARR